MSGRWDRKSVPTLTGKVAVVTGANSGLGLEVARVLAERGAKVLMACRNQQKAEGAIAMVRAHVAEGGSTELVTLDLASLASTADAAEQIRSSQPAVDILVNNAGLMAVDQGQTQDGFETQFGVNHLGHFAFTAHLAPTLLATPGSRVVNVASFGHRLGHLDLGDLMFERRGYDRWRPYFQSKLSNLLFTLELERRLEAVHATTSALAAHPGASNTDLGHEGTGIFNKLLKPLAPMGTQPTWMGALPILRAATDPEARGGQFYGPQFMFMGYPRVETPSRAARSADKARKLWAKSEELTGVTFTIPSGAET
jgi:NAD(P)-dependent dehydrogenase (short-subunit alcohol dehydrogenase family)